MFRAIRRFVATLCLLAWILPLGGQQSGARIPGRTVEWRHYASDLANTHYSSVDQINGANFNQLRVAWRFKTESLGPRPETNLQSTPLMINGVVYSTAGSRRAVVALDAATGELMWVHSEREGPRGDNAPRNLSGRGLAYWNEGNDERILYVTPGYRLIALNAKNGAPVATFGQNGGIDLKLESGTVFMPAGQTGTPMTYMLDGKQYIVVAIGGANYPSELLAFKLPN